MITLCDCDSLRLGAGISSCSDDLCCESRITVLVNRFSQRGHPNESLAPDIHGARSALVHFYGSKQLFACVIAFHLLVVVGRISWITRTLAAIAKSSSARAGTAQVRIRWLVRNEVSQTMRTCTQMVLRLVRAMMIRLIKE